MSNKQITLTGTLNIPFKLVDRKGLRNYRYRNRNDEDVSSCSISQGFLKVPSGNFNKAISTFKINKKDIVDNRTESPLKSFLKVSENFFLA